VGPGLSWGRAFRRPGTIVREGGLEVDGRGRLPAAAGTLKIWKRYGKASLNKGPRVKLYRKLLLLLLSIALFPLLAGVLLERRAMLGLGNNLAAGTKEELSQRAKEHLQGVVAAYSRLLGRKGEAMELALRLQAFEVEKRLAAPPPETPAVLPSAPVGLFGEDGSLEPLEAEREEELRGLDSHRQGYFLVKGVSVASVAADFRRLASMTAVYRRLFLSHREGVLWYYTSLENGLHTNYPGGGTLPSREAYDPRTRPWYTAARKAGTVTWSPPMVDASSGKVVLTVSMPVRRPDGSFAGVTAMDITLPVVFEELNLPSEWAAEARAMIVRGPESESEAPTIVVQDDYADEIHDWAKPLESRELTSDSPEELALLLEDVRSGKTGVRSMGYREEPSFWAYGPLTRGGTFPLVVIPTERILKRAVEAERMVKRETTKVLQVTGFLILGVVAIVVLVALWASRSITHPIKLLTEAARKIAAGDFETRVSIRTGDELEELGSVFNDMGPQLAEHEEMQRTVELVTAVQQNLLPRETPRMSNFDLAGTVSYCDKTGGDYYDFIEFGDSLPGHVGFIVGDITGHGMGSAFMMASARGVMRALAVRHGTAIREFLAECNRHLSRDFTEGSFLTLFYGVVCDSDRTIRWASAGHDPAYLFKGEEVTELRSTGIPLGVLEGMSFEEGTPFALESGDIFVVGTDGVREARNEEGEMFEEERLCETVREFRAASAREIHDAVLEAVRRFRGSTPQHDDVTLLVVKAL